MYKVPPKGNLAAVLPLGLALGPQERMRLGRGSQAGNDTGCLGLVHWNDPEGWYGEGGGRGVQDGEHIYNHGGFMLML